MKATARTAKNTRDESSDAGAERTRHASRACGAAAKAALACALACALVASQVPASLIAAASGEDAADTATQASAASAKKSSSKKSIEKATVTLSKTRYVYDGSGKRPKVTVTYKGKTLKKGRDYKVYYQYKRKPRISSDGNSRKWELREWGWLASSTYRREEPGTYRVLVKGAGSYSGKVSAKYKIVDTEGLFVEDCGLGHTWVEKTVRKPTAKKTGKTVWTCSVCGETECETTKLENTIKVKKKHVSVTVKASTLKKRSVTIKKKRLFKYSGNTGRVEYDLGGNVYRNGKRIQHANTPYYAIKFNMYAEDGDLIITKGVKKGTYKMEIFVDAIPDKTHYGKSVKIALTVKVV